MKPSGRLRRRFFINRGRRRNYKSAMWNVRSLGKADIEVWARRVSLSHKADIHKSIGILAAKTLRHPKPANVVSRVI